MPQTLLEELRQRRGGVVSLRCKDGEVLSGRVGYVNGEGEVQYVICKVLATNRPEKPAYAKGGMEADYLICLDDLEGLETEAGE